MSQKFSDLALTRRSIRKFQDQDIELSEIEEFIKIAVSAPSGFNNQCWKFIAIKDKTILNRIADAAMQKITEMTAVLKPGPSEEYFLAKRKAVSFFVEAPVTVVVFMTSYKYSDPVMESAIKAYGFSNEALLQLFSHPDILSIGAAVQNLLLAIHEKGYGACWINEPTIAGAEINRILKMPLDYKFMSLVPIGIPAYTPREKKMKEFKDIFNSI